MAARASTMGTRRRGGFTLVELCIAVALAGLLVVLAVPSLQGQWIAARRADGTAALQRLMMAQERHHAAHGLYAADLRTLGASDRSGEGLYRIELSLNGTDGWAAVARPLAGSAQAGDRECGALTLNVEHGFARPGPSAACWRR